MRFWSCSTSALRISYLNRGGMKRLRHPVRIWFAKEGIELAFQDVSCRAHNRHRDRAVAFF